MVSPLSRRFGFRSWASQRIVLQTKTKRDARSETNHEMLMIYETWESIIQNTTYVINLHNNHGHTCTIYVDHDLSHWHCVGSSPSPNSVRFGLSYVKNVLKLSKSSLHNSGSASRAWDRCRNVGSVQCIWVYVTLALVWLSNQATKNPSGLPWAGFMFQLGFRACVFLVRSQPECSKQTHVISLRCSYQMMYPIGMNRTLVAPTLWPISR